MNSSADLRIMGQPTGCTGNGAAHCIASGRRGRADSIPPAVSPPFLKQRVRGYELLTPLQVVDAAPDYMAERKIPHESDLEKPSPYFVKFHADFIEIGRWGGSIWISHESAWVLDDYIISAVRVERGYVANATLRGRKKNVSLSRVIMGVTEKDLVVDHINGNTLDNRIPNLRVCNRSQNSHNRSKKIVRTSRFKGVSRAKSRWIAVIYKGNVREHIGLFDSEEEAARAYDERARSCFGEYACLNFAQDGEQSVFRELDHASIIARSPQSASQQDS